MSVFLKILHLEDNRTDAELVQESLENGGIQCHLVRVDTRADFESALESETFDLVIADYSLPSFDGRSALAIARERSPLLPFIFVSGSLGEERAVETLKSGATDYVLKDRLTRLSPAVRRALAESEERSKRLKAEQALRESEQDYRDLFENASDALFTLDKSGRITAVNRTAELITGYERHKLFSRHAKELVSPEYHSIIDEMLQCNSGNDVQATQQIELTAKGGRRVTLEVSSRPIFKGGEMVGVQGTARDVTERNLLQEQLAQSQKMDAIGRLAGGVAHDFNNLLTAIIGYSQILLSGLNEQDPSFARLTEIEKAGKRAASLTNQLLAFSRKQVLQPHVLDLNVVVSELGKLLRRLIGEHITLVTKFDPALWQVKADPSQIEQIILNLAINARDAMPGGGTLTIQTTNVHLDESYSSHHLDSHPGPHVMVAVSDTGVGMDRQTQSRIFEPFFTTKEKGKGTGLGLSMVYGIVKQSGGTVRVYSERGRGTTFKIYLPRTAEAQSVAQTVDSNGKVLSGSETILVAEDEGAVRAFARTVLTARGYNVLEASTGAEAMLICQQAEAPIHLLLTDMVLPDVGGGSLARAVLTHRSETKVLYMSGYTDEAISQQGVLEPDMPFLEKPFTPDGLAGKVRELLDS